MRLVLFVRLQLGEPRPEFLNLRLMNLQVALTVAALLHQRLARGGHVLELLGSAPEGGFRGFDEMGDFFLFLLDVHDPEIKGLQVDQRLKLWVQLCLCSIIVLGLRRVPDGWWAHQDSNLGPADYESAALTT